MTDLPTQIRGDKFDYSNSLQGDWVASMFTEFWFTLRTSVPPSGELTDTGPGVVAQAKMSGGQIVFSTSKAFRILLPGSTTKGWPRGRDLYWDFRGLADDVVTLDSGIIPVDGDITRGTTP